VKTGDVVGIVVLAVLLPAFVGYLVWLLRVRPRQFAREQLARAQEVGRALGLPDIEPGVARGVRDGLAVEVVYRTSSTPYSRGRPVTVCRAWLARPFPVAFAVATARRYAAGVTRRCAGDVWIGGPDDAAIQLATSFAPLVEAHGRTMKGALSLELDRATSCVLLDGTVVDPGRLHEALSSAIDLAKAATTR
jgi:hypothetical protein